MPSPSQANILATNHQTGTRSDYNAELTAVGEGIVGRLSPILEHKIGVTNLSGSIIADSDLSNFDKFVPSSIAAIQKGAPTSLPANEIDEMAGWAVPLKHQEKLFGTLIIRNDPAPSDDVIPLAKSLAELLMYQMLIMDKIAQQNRVLDKFFYDLFQNASVDQEKLLRDSLFFNSQFFQIDFHQPRIAASILLENFWKDVLKGQPILPPDEHKLTAIKDQIKDAAKEILAIDDAIVAYLGIDEFALLLPRRASAEKETKKKSNGRKTAENSGVYTMDQLQKLAEKLETALARPAYVGLGQFRPEITGLVESYKGARKAAALGRRLQPKAKVYAYNEWLLPIILEQADENLQKQFVENELGELIGHPDLMETLSSHFDSNLNLKKTAYELGIHKNTLYYRLAKIKKILERDPQEFGQAVRLKAALYLWQILEKENAA